VESSDLAIFRNLDHTEAGNFRRVNGQRGQRHVRAGAVVVLQHLAVIHLVDVVAGKNQHVLRLLRANRINVLVNRVRCAHVPVGAHALHGGQNLDELAQLRGHGSGPALANMAVQ
jgi:hypothetical protein